MGLTLFFPKNLQLHVVKLARAREFQSGFKLYEVTGKIKAEDEK